MAKTKQPKRDAGLRLPKRVAGVKVPKELRRTAERAIDMVVEQANSPRGREVIASGLSMAAAAATAAMVSARETQRTAGGIAPEHTPPARPVPPVPPRAPGTMDAPAVADAVAQAAEMMLGRLFGTRRT